VDELIQPGTADSGALYNAACVYALAGTKFPQFSADASLKWQGKTYYLVGKETRREFKKQQSIGSK
jgi:hypothetical protein